MRQYRKRTESNSNRVPNDGHASQHQPHAPSPLSPVVEEPALSQQRKTNKVGHHMGGQRIVAGEQVLHYSDHPRLSYGEAYEQKWAVPAL